MGSWAWMLSVSSTGFWGAGTGWMAPGSHNGWGMWMTEWRRVGMLVVLHDTPKSPLMPSGESLSSAPLSPHPAGILRCSPLDIPFRGPRVMIWAERLAALSEDLTLLARTHVRWLRTACNCRSRGTDVLFCLHGHLHICSTCAHTCSCARTQIHTHTHRSFLSFVRWKKDLRPKLFLSHSFKFKGLILPFNKWIMTEKCCLFHTK